MDTDEVLQEDTAAKKIYEVGYIVSPEIPENDVVVSVGNLKETLRTSGVVFLNEEFTKMRPLTYTMVKSVGGKRHKYGSGYFGWVKFEAGADSVKKIEAALKSVKELVRFILVKTIKENTLFAPKFHMDRPKEPRRMFKPAKIAPALAVSEEELDKTIAALVAE